MEYIAKHTSIPVPKVYAVHTTRNHHLYLEMEYIEGKDLEGEWLRRGELPQEEQDTICADLTRYLSILRELPPPVEDFVGSALQNPAYDGRIGYRFFGPFSHSEFHSLT